MPNKITDETLKFTIVINGNEAKKEFAQLERNQKKLLQANADLEQKAKDLEKANKKGTVAYKKLKEQIEENSKTMQGNEARMKKLTKEIGLNNLSTKQLAKEARRLNAIIGNFDPNSKQYKKYAKDLRAVKARQRELRLAVNQTSKAMEKQDGFLKKLGKSLKDVFFPVAGAIAFTDILKKGLEIVKEFISDSIKLAEESQGVEFAFKKLGDEGEASFRRIKKQTRGLLSDLDIKKSIIEFDNFNISQKETGTLFEFLTVRAAQSGESVDKLKDSLVEGLSKKSRERIDNLGISTARLNKELESTPDFVQAVANIAKTEIARAGNILDEAANGSEKWNVKLQNTQLRIGKLVKDSGAIGFFQGMGAAILETLIPAEKLSDAIQKEQVALNVLVTKITDVNTSEEERSRLIGNLSEKYPVFLKFLGKEKTDNESLSTALKEINELYIKRIALQTQQEEIEELLADAGKEAFRLAKSQVAVDKELAKINTGLLKGSLDLTNTTYEQRIKLVREALSVNAEFSTSQRTNVTSAINEEARALRRLQQMTIQTGAVKNNQSKINKELTEEQELMTQIEKNLGVTIDEINKIFTVNTEEKNKNKGATQELTEAQKKAQQQAQKDLETFLKLRLKLQNDIAQKEAGDEFERKKLKIEQNAIAQRAEVDALFISAEKKREAKKLIDEQERLALEENDKAKEDAELKRLADFENRKKELENELALLREENEIENEILKAEQAIEKQRLELENLKLTEEEKAALLKLLKEKELKVIADIEKKGRDEALKDKKVAAKKEIEARKKLNNEIIAQSVDLVGRESRLGQALLAIKGIFAAKETLIGLGLLKAKVATNTAAATADIAAGTAATAKVGFPQNIPLLIGFAAQVAGIIGAIKGAASSQKKIETPKVEGFEKGLYPMTRTDGKVFNTRFGGAPRTQMVKAPTHFIAGENGKAGFPELIVDGDTFKKMDPSVTQYILGLSGRGPTKTPGFEGGYYPKPQNNEESTMQLLKPLFEKVMEKLDEPLFAQTIYDSDASIKRSEYDEKIRRSRENAKIGS